MASAWRIVLSSEAAQAFSGEGSRRYGGRWNSPGVRAVYASEHQSTAALEIFIHNQPFLPDEGYKAFHLQWPDRMTEVFVAKNLPADWRIIPAPRSTMEIGDQWVLEERSAVLAVPSLLSTSELNFLLNPAHRDFKKIKIGKPLEYRFDSRLVGR